jgi:hypothetical protein
MDRLWAEAGLKIDMVIYEVMETGFETGYIEFVDNSTVIAECHKEAGYYCGTFKADSIMKFFVNKIVNDPNDKYKFYVANTKDGDIKAQFEK